MPLTSAPPEASIPLTLGFLFLIGLVADLVGRHTFLPRVTLLLLGGLAVGPSGLGLIRGGFIEDWFPPLTSIALGMIGFLLGEKLTLESMRRSGILVLGFSIGKALGAAGLVFAVLALFGVDLPVALLLGGIATATAPAATYDVVEESGARGSFSDTLLGVVAIDDAWGLLLFTLLMAAAGALLGQSGLQEGLVSGINEIAGSLILGVALGVPMAFLTGRVRRGEPTLAEALGLVMLATGLAAWLGVSPVLAAMAMGSTVANLARHHLLPFHAIKGIEWPFFIVFFVLAGASLELERLAEVGAVGALYVVARTLGTYFGARLGGRLAGAPALMRHWLGLALLPQAGVAIGMALIASQRFPERAELLLSVVLSSTVIFEIFAPVVTRRVLKIAGSSI